MMSSTQSISSSGAITFSGLATGIDTSSIVSQLMSLERAPEQVLTSQKTKMQNQVSAYNQLSSALTSLQSLMVGMNTADTFAAKTASVADSTVAGATASSSAQAGTHTLKVTSLAQSQTLVSESSTNSGYASDTAQNFGTGTISIANTADPLHPVTVNIDNTNNSLQGIAAAINGSGANITASVVNDGSGTPFRLAIIGKDTNTYSVTSGLTGGTYDAPTFAEKVSASQAVFQLDGIDMTRTTNTVSNALTGVTLTLQGLTNSSNSSGTTITIGNDTAAVTTKINNFVSGYNNVMNLINQDTAYDSTTNTAGVLFGDSTIRTVLDTLQTTLTNQLSGGAGSFSSLADIGITTDAHTGVLSVDSSKLSSALSTDFNSVTSLFTQNTGNNGLALSQYGIAEQFNQQIDFLTHFYSGYSETGANNNGIISTRIQGLNDSMTDIDNQIAAMELRFTAEESSLTAQFTAMEQTVSNTTAWGNQLLAGLGVSTTSTSK
ncbi:MAG: flagellar filament capping protein FliD [Geobacteraceae bacterium]|jgi:flagellar hook-associated protein 2